MLDYQNIPFLSVPSGFCLSPCGALTENDRARARFRFRMEDDFTNAVSVYLDDSDAFGCVGEPYWEIYPNADGDAERFMLIETSELMSALIRAAFVSAYKELQNA